MTITNASFNNSINIICVGRGIKKLIKQNYLNCSHILQFILDMFAKVWEDFIAHRKCGDKLTNIL